MNLIEKHDFDAEAFLLTWMREHSVELHGASYNRLQEHIADLYEKIAQLQARVEELEHGKTA